ncbi:MAG TPA: hypothetical protein VIK99_06095, partial [Thermaerobacter sp.]
KHVVASWWRENSKEAYSSGLDALARALQNWSKSRKGERKGPRVGFPPLPEEGARPRVGAVYHRRDPGGRQEPRRPAPDRAGEDPRTDHGPGPS